MSVNIIKLCVGIDTLPELAAWQAQRLQERVRSGGPAELYHITRSTPKRAAEVLDGGSIYWVMKGRIVARQRMLDIRPMARGDQIHCAFVLDPELVTVEPYPRRPFQGWRYLEMQDAPRDRGLAGVDDEMPEDMRRVLEELGLL